MKRTASYIMVFMSFLLVACGGSEGEATSVATVIVSDGPTSTATTASTQPTLAATALASATVTATVASATATVVMPSPTSSPNSTASVEIPDSAVGERLSLMLDEINQGGQGLTTGRIEEIFAPSVFDALPAEQLGQALRAFAASDGPLALESFYAPPTPTEAVAIVTSRSGADLLLTISVEESAPHRITAFFAQPAPVATEVESWDDFLERASDLAPSVSVLVAELIESECRPIAAAGADQQLAIGSAFKLYVLGELARQVEAGTVSWDDEIAVQEQWKSLPSGTLQDAPAGTMVTLRRLAELMISISDNTATDHLVHHLGRHNVAAMMSTMGHSEPERNDPFITTREMFVLKLSLGDELVARYIDATAAERLEILENEAASAELNVEAAEHWTSPRHIDDIEWFASGSDLCGAMGWLDEASQRDGIEPLREILSINAGVPIDDTVWSWVGFKGGSEPGVLNLTWLLERADGRSFVLTASFNDGEILLDEAAIVQLMMGAIDALEVEP